MTTKYELFLCDVTGEHKLIAKLESTTPFMAVQAGDRFDDHGWDRLNGVGKIASEKDPKRYTIHSIKHTIVEKEGDLFVQSWLNLHPYQGPRSPAWGDD